MKAFVLAAGLGTRLQPLTESIPKALVECNGMPLVEHVLRYLERQGIVTVIVNVHHRGGQIVDYLSANPPVNLQVVISDERPELKDTGGALVAALPWIGPEEDLFICNVDVLTNLKLAQLLNVHIETEADATLVVQHRESARQLALDANLRITGWINHKTGQTLGNPNDESRWVGFTGIWVVKGRLVHAFATKYGSAPFAVIPALLNHLGSHNIKGYVPPSDTIWLEAGNPERLSAAAAFLKENPGFV